MQRSFTDSDSEVRILSIYVSTYRGGALQKVWNRGNRIFRCEIDDRAWLVISLPGFKPTYASYAVRGCLL